MFNPPPLRLGRPRIQGDADAHLAEQAQHGRNVVEMRQVGQAQRLGGQRRRREIGSAAFLAPEMATSPEGPTLNQQLIHAARSILPGSGS